MKVDAVFEGGGVRGIGHVGAISVLEDRGYTFENVAGASAGAIAASLVAAGYKAKELTAIMEAMPYPKIADKGLLDHLPIIGPLLSVIFEKGIYEGDFLETWLRKKLAAKGVHTFSDLVMEDYKDSEKFRYKLQVVASDITTGRMLTLPGDIEQFGEKPDDLDVARAVRMSMSIPLFFEPVLKNDTAGKKHYIVDGGLLSNFPVWIFDDGQDPLWPTFGLRLVDPKAEQNEVGGPMSFLIAMAKTMLSAHDEKHIRDADFVRTIPIRVGDVGFTDFDLTKKQQQALFKSGQQAAEKFLNEWDFEIYKKDFRKQEPVSRGTRLRRGL